MKLTQPEIEALTQGLTPELVNKLETKYRPVIKKLLGRLQKGDSYELFVDGAADLHTGRAGIGGVIYRDGEEISSFAESLPGATNNEAEYQALITGLRLALKLKIDRLVIKSDSELVVKQLNGVYRVKHERMVPLHQTVKSLLEKFDECTINHIPREKNDRADRLSKTGMKAG